MEPTTFRNMDISELGDDATADDLAAFRQACQLRQQETGESDADVTGWMWGQGDWPERVNAYLGQDPQGVE